MAMQPTLAPAPHQQQNAQVSLDNSVDHVLRAQLIAATSGHQQQQQRGAPHGLPEIQNGSSSSSTHSHNIDPAIANNGSGMMSNSAGESGGDDGDGKKGQKRELSTSKRAAQNRAAQRAFRQRKEGHIKALEQQVRDYTNLADNYKALQNENYRLRDYIIALQRRLIESQGEVPQPPPDIDLTQQQAPMHHAQAQALQQHAAQQQAQAQAQAQHQANAALAQQQQQQQQQSVGQAPTAQMSVSPAGGDKGKGNAAGKQKGPATAPYDHRAATLKDVPMGGWGSGVASASS